MRSLTILVPFLATAHGFHQSTLLRRARVNTLAMKTPTPTIPSRSAFGFDQQIVLWRPTKPIRAASGSEATKDPNYEDLVEGRQILSMVGYRVSSLIYLFLSLFLISWQGTKSPANLPLTCYVTAGPMLAAGVSYVLEGAAVNDRLSSNTFERLNLLLAKYGFLWLVGAYLVRNTPSKIVTNPLVLAASLITVVNSLKAWIYGVKGWDKKSRPGNTLVGELVAGTKTTLEILGTRRNLSGPVYLGACTMTLGLKVSKILEIFKLVQSGTATGAMICKEVLQYSMYALLNGVLFTLKDGGGTMLLCMFLFVLYCDVFSL